MNTRKVIKTVFYPLVLMRREFIRGGYATINAITSVNWQACTTI